MEIKLIENTEKKLTIGVSGEVTTLDATEFKSSILSFRENNPTGLLTFDFDELEYISSAGLRVIMMLLKSEKEKFHIINTSDEVFDTLYVTGFTGKIDIRKRIRKISIDGAKLIGKGANGDVMRLNADTVIKVYHPGTSIDVINREQDMARLAFQSGIPTAIAYDVVTTGERYGIVFEMLAAKMLNDVIKENPDRFDEYAHKYTDTMRSFHEFDGDISGFLKTKEIYLSYIDDLGDWYTEDEIGKLRWLVESIPDRETLIHGDYHPHNIMVLDDELIIIDMGDVSVGHSIFDFLSTASTQANLVDLNPDYALVHTGMPVEYIKRLWNALLEIYFEGKDETEIRQIDKTSRLFSRLKVAFAPVIARGVPDEIIRASVDDAKSNLLPIIDEMPSMITW